MVQRNLHRHESWFDYGGGGADVESVGDGGGYDAVVVAAAAEARLPPVPQLPRATLPEAP